MIRRLFTQARSLFLYRLLRNWLLLSALILWGVWSLAQSTLMLHANQFIYDRLLPLYPRTANTDIVLIQIDNKSLSELGQWPWNRSVHGALLTQLAKSKPKAVLLDVIFTEPAKDPNQDAALANGLKQLDRVVAPVLLTPNHNDGLKATLPIPEVMLNTHVGEIAILPDEDGVIREVNLSEQDETGKRWPLMTTLLSDDLPHQGTLRIPFNVPLHGYMSFSASELLKGEVPADFLHNKYILIGATATGLGDRFPTPNANSYSTMPGVEIHANILDAQLNGLSIQVVGLYWALLPVAAFLLCLLLLREPYHLAALAVFLVGYAVVVMVLLWFAQVWVAPMSSIVGLLFAYVLWSWLRMSLMLKHVNRELFELRAQTGLIGQLLPKSREGIQPHSLELNINYAHYLSQFVSNSLQHLPIAVLLVNEYAQVMMHNDIAQKVFGENYLLHCSIIELLGKHGHTDVASLHQTQWQKESHTYRLHVVQMQFNPPHESMNTVLSKHIIWQVFLIDLTNELSAQRQRSELMTFLSHDLRVPQVAILSLIELYQNSAQADHTSALLADITEKVHDTLDSANGLVHLAQAQDGQYRMMEVNFITLISNATSQVWAQAGAKQITLCVDHSMDDWFEQTWVWGDAALLTRALVNIFTNAIRYSERLSTVYISLKVQENYAVCSIRDEGIGMSEQQMQTLNSHLTKGSVAPSQYATQKPDRAGSLGVGLNMVTTVIKNHYGQVWFTDAASSHEHRGTICHIQLNTLPS